MIHSTAINYLPNYVPRCCLVCEMHLTERALHLTFHFSKDCSVCCLS
ncbi:unnamed protein product [Spirodela intermedia]|uniref:Uncharacterized protein n=2 Tax=Spirodela intermedia TaxID=51605 RepID=A0A7I8L8R1_SPIIN|nr:unnamed protein product [Spirodela intermedia]CAA6669059.1 unnamed protein product [Spirodela intermedia]CAA7406006.1 unnamed protein product [Spirodela intermedia]